MLRAAVIGVGSMGRNHARVYREMEDSHDVQLVAVSDNTDSTAARVGRLMGVPHYEDYHHMLDIEEPDLVTLAVPTGLHHSIGLDLIERGIHVLMEKPIAKTVQEAQELVEHAKQYGVVLAVGHIERFNPAVSEMRTHLQEGMIGDVYKLYAQRLSPYPARIHDAGVVIDLASHDIDLMRYLMNGDRMCHIHGEIMSTINQDREDLFIGTARFESGALAVLDVNWVTPMKHRLLTVTGALGMFRCDLLSQELYYYENASGPQVWDTHAVLRGVSQGKVIGFPVNRQEPLRAELQDFVEAVANRQSPAVTGADGLETLRVALEFIHCGAEQALQMA